MIKPEDKGEVRLSLQITHSDHDLTYSSMGKSDDHPEDYDLKISSLLGDVLPGPLERKLDTLLWAITLIIDLTDGFEERVLRPEFNDVRLQLQYINRQIKTAQPET